MGNAERTFNVCTTNHYISDKTNSGKDQGFVKNLCKISKTLHPHPLKEIIEIIIVIKDKIPIKLPIQIPIKIH